MKKVLFILHYPPPVHGAAMVGQYIRESKTVNDSFNCHYINLSTSESVDHIGKGGWKKWKRFLHILWKTFVALLKFQPNLVYITLTASGIGFYKDAVIALLAKAFGKKVVYHFHNKGVSIRQDKPIDNLLYSWVFRKSEVILLSEQLYSDIEKYVPKKHVHFCGNGIPDLQMQLENNPTLSAEGEPVELLFLSNLIATKGVLELLQTCSQLKNLNLDFRCIFIGGEGDIDAKTLREKISHLELENHVHYAGRRYGADKVKAYQKADIFVLPTHYPNECFPLVLLEAMQFALPIVSTFEGGISTIVEDNKTGFLVQQKDVETLTKKIAQLIEDKSLRQKMGINGQTRFKKEFTIDVFEKRFTKILKEIV